MKDLEHNTSIKNIPAYRYIRESDKLPSTDAAWAEDNFICKVKLFNPTGPGTWWIAGYDPERRMAVGIAEIHEREVGDIYMPELVAFRGRLGMFIERDLHYQPKSMKGLMIDA